MLLYEKCRNYYEVTIALTILKCLNNVVFIEVRHYKYPDLKKIVEIYSFVHPSYALIRKILLVKY
jgi:hypothetical protein